MNAFPQEAEIIRKFKKKKKKKVITWIDHGSVGQKQQQSSSSSLKEKDGHPLATVCREIRLRPKDQELFHCLLDCSL